VTRLSPHDPHATLGAHATADGGVVVRALRPAAESVTVQPHGVRLEHVGDGIWEGAVEGAELPLRYELEVRYPDGVELTLKDPYAFLPTLGEIDLHLLGEGRHETLYEKLGAHVRELDGVTGVSFAVWAPAARAVSVVGDFNGWDGRLHPMRSLGSSGVWELFVPDVAEWAVYRYEIRTQSGELREKSDPLAFHTETPPANAYGSAFSRISPSWVRISYL
jgi:1,4-alpha-glucan branching enzyme